MTQPPEPPEQPQPSIYTRLDGSPLPPQPQVAPVLPGTPAPAPTGWSSPAAAQQQRAGGGQQYVLATWWSRVGAYLIDALLFGSIAWAVMLPVGTSLGLTLDESVQFFSRLTPLPERISDPTNFYIAVVVQAMIPGIALSLALLWMDGQTPGKRVAGIRVVRADGAPMDAQTAFRRELAVKTIALGLLAIVTLGAGWIINYVWPLRDRECRAGHDIAIGTRVVQAPRKR